MKLSELKPIGQFTTNVHCGLVDYQDKQLIGCGKIGRYKRFTYKLDNYELWSGVSLCNECLKTV